MAPFPELYVPARTVVEEHDIVAPGPALLGPELSSTLGLRAQTAVIGHGSELTRHVETDGDLIVGHDVRLGDLVVAGGDATLAGGVTATGSVYTNGTLTVEETTHIEGEFVAEGGTEVGNSPAATLLLGIFARHLLAGGALQPPPPLVVPPAGTITDDRWTVDTPATIGPECRIHGNISARTLTVGADTTVFGGLQAQTAITIEAGGTVHGDVVSESGTVTVGTNSHLRGDIRADQARVAADAVVEGRIRASGEVTFES